MDTVIASEAKQSTAVPGGKLDCFVASLPCTNALRLSQAMTITYAMDMKTFHAARAFSPKHRTDYDAAVKGFRWPDPVPFNWALDWFDAELAKSPDSRDRAALWIVDAAANSETKLSFAELSRRSN